MKKALTKKLGPLPRWAWILIAVVVLYLLYRYEQNKSSSNAQNSQDPNSTYNGSSPYDPSAADAYGGSYPLGGGAGGGFDPTSFEEGLSLGQGQGTTSTDNSNGSPLPDPVGSAVTAVDTSGGSTATSTRTPTNRRKTTHKHGNHPATHPGTRTGGGPPKRHRETHTKDPRKGTHRTATTSKMRGTGTTKVDRKKKADRGIDRARTRGSKSASRTTSKPKTTTRGPIGDKSRGRTTSKPRDTRKKRR